MFIQQKPSSGYLTVGTSKFVHQLLMLKMLGDLKLLEQQIYWLKVFSRMPTYSPIDQTKIVKLGSGVEVIVNKKNMLRVFLDGAVVARNELPTDHHLIITADSMFGKALINSNCGDKKHYKENGKFFNFEVYRIRTYSEGKQEFFKKDMIVVW